MTARFGAGVAAAQARFGAAAIAQRRDALAARIAAEVPEVAVATGADDVRVSAPGLVARVFGSRRRGPDPRLSMLMEGGR